MRGGLSASSGSNGSGGSGCNNRDLDINQPACRMEEFPMGTVEDEEDAANPRPKKLRLTKEQSGLLEESFRENQTLNPKKKKEALAFNLKLKPRQVEVWFQNRRARTKLKQTEKECEYLRRCFRSLREENRRLQRDVEELRALHVAPPTVLSPHIQEPMSPSALTMCPRCEHVTASGAAGATSAASDDHSPRPVAGPFARVPNPFRQPSAAC